MKCKKHPTYKALRPPRADCRACRQMRIKQLAAEIQVRMAEQTTLVWRDTLAGGVFPKDAGNTVDVQYYRRSMSGKAVLYRVLGDKVHYLAGNVWWPSAFRPVNMGHVYFKPLSLEEAQKYFPFDSAK